MRKLDPIALDFTCIWCYFKCRMLTMEGVEGEYIRCPRCFRKVRFSNRFPKKNARVKNWVKEEKLKEWNKGLA